jgi:hypothetical protein
MTEGGKGLIHTWAHHRTPSRWWLTLRCNGSIGRWPDFVLSMVPAIRMNDFSWFFFAQKFPYLRIFCDKPGENRDLSYEILTLKRFAVKQ